MTEQKIDKRVARTKTRLKEGLADLMTRKSIQEITVKELVEYVHINRSTFYLHYSDISNMLENVKRELIEEIAEVMESYPPEPFPSEKCLRKSSRKFPEGCIPRTLRWRSMKSSSTEDMT